MKTFFTVLTAAVLALMPVAAECQSTYEALQNLLSTNNGWNPSSNGLWVLPATSTNVTAAADVREARDITLFTRWDAMATNAALSNIVFQAYSSLGGGTNAPAGSGSYNSTTNGIPAWTPPTNTDQFAAPFANMNIGPTNGLWARDPAFDFTNFVNGGNSVSNVVNFNGLGGRGWIYWLVSYTGGNTLTNFLFGYSVKNGLR